MLENYKDGYSIFMEFYDESVIEEILDDIIDNPHPSKMSALAQITKKIFDMRREELVETKGSLFPSTFDKFFQPESF